MRKHVIRLVAVVICICMMTTAFTAASQASSRVVRVVVDPAFGRHAGRVTVLMTQSELATVQSMPAGIPLSAFVTPATAGAAHWIIEPSATNSRVLALSREVLKHLQVLLESLGLVRVNTTRIVVGRTQSFINDSLSRLGCFPNLSRTNGVHLMGSSLCNRSVIVINLTGYFFLRRITDELTRAMESAAEPRLRTVDYRIADRNISGLAHEWAHIARASETRGFVPSDEPAWVREGFAEVMAGIAQSLAFNGRYSYMDFHVIRLRKFADWGRFCSKPLRHYRVDSKSLGGCEYYVGSLGIEYLIARMGGLDRLVALFRLSSDLGSFSRAFRLTYGLPLGAFEKRIDGYVHSIAQLPDAE